MPETKIQVYITVVQCICYPQAEDEEETDAEAIDVDSSESVETDKETADSASDRSDEIDKETADSTSEEQIAGKFTM